MYEVVGPNKPTIADGRVYDMASESISKTGSSVYDMASESVTQAGTSVYDMATADSPAKARGSLYDVASKENRPKIVARAGLPPAIVLSDSLYDPATMPDAKGDD